VIVDCGWQWALDPASISVAGAVLTGRLDGGEDGAPPLGLTVRALDTGAVRIRVVEQDGRPPRWEVRRRLQCLASLLSTPRACFKRDLGAMQHGHC
jgi:hypothetical protein